jgi:hypothetical protein
LERVAAYSTILRIASAKPKSSRGLARSAFNARRVSSSPEWAAVRDLSNNERAACWSTSQYALTVSNWTDNPLGAKERDIWSQFLIEAAFLTLAGGVIGIIGGWGISWLIDNMGVTSTVVTSDIVILAVSVSVAIGLFFGFYPAWNASRLNPIEALRSE